jgi:hypothetical protein
VRRERWSGGHMSVRGESGKGLKGDPHKITHSGPPHLLKAEGKGGSRIEP